MSRKPLTHLGWAVLLLVVMSALIFKQFVGVWIVPPSRVLVPVGGVVHVDVKLVNRSLKAVAISEVSTSCGCLAFEHGPTSVGRFSSASLRFRVDGAQVDATSGWQSASIRLGSGREIIAPFEVAPAPFADGFPDRAEFRVSSEGQAYLGVDHHYLGRTIEAQIDSGDGPRPLPLIGGDTIVADPAVLAGPASRLKIVVDRGLLSEARWDVPVAMSN